MIAKRNNMNQASNIGWCNWVCIIQEGPQLKAPYKSSTDCVNFPYTIRFHKGDTQYPGTKHGARASWSTYHQWCSSQQKFRLSSAHARGIKNALRTVFFALWLNICLWFFRNSTLSLLPCVFHKVYCFIIFIIIIINNNCVYLSFFVFISIAM